VWEVNRKSQKARFQIQASCCKNPIWKWSKVCFCHIQIYGRTGKVFIGLLVEYVQEEFIDVLFQGESSNKTFWKKVLASCGRSFKPFSYYVVEPWFFSVCQMLQDWFHFIYFIASYRRYNVHSAWINIS